MPKIVKSDGIEIVDKEIVIDSRKHSKKANIVSHAHFDHIHTDNNSKIVSSDITSFLVSERTGKSYKSSESYKDVTLLNSGHIVGSSAALIEQVKNKSVLYTGDVSIRDRLYLKGFKPVSADILIIESTYGKPNYKFPDTKTVEQNIKDFLNYNSSPKFLFGYSLGKAQKIQKIVQKHSDKEIIVDKNIAKMNEAVEKSTGVEFDYETYTEEFEDLLVSDDAVLISSTASRKKQQLRKLVDEAGGVKVGFSGWAVNNSYEYRTGFDESFVLSDHADFNELESIVSQVSPERVYTVHGFVDEFASYLRRKGINARSLKSNQSSLIDF